MGKVDGAHIPLNQAVLCLECENISVRSLHDRCSICGAGGEMLNLDRILNRTRPVVATVVGYRDAFCYGAIKEEEEHG